MTEIVPAILTADTGELERLLTLLKSAGVSRVHLDITDDTLVPGRTVSGHEELAGRDLGMALDIHLMVSKPQEALAGWESVPGLSRVIAHVEADDDLERVSTKCASLGKEFWAAINPDTPLGKLTGLSCHLHGAMCMTVIPGAQGRPFREDALEKIRLLKAERDITVMVDGGINPKTAPLCTGAGASILVCGSYIVGANDPAAALQALAQSVQSPK